MTCLLCARQFKSLDQLKRHNKESGLHKARLLLMQYCQSELTISLVAIHLFCRIEEFQGR